MLWRVCANAQACKNIRRLHAQNMEIYKSSNQNLEGLLRLRAAHPYLGLRMRAKYSCVMSWSIYT